MKGTVKVERIEKIVKRGCSEMKEAIISMTLHQIVIILKGDVFVVKLILRTSMT